jgi:hypothetical protein
MEPKFGRVGGVDDLQPLAGDAINPSTALGIDLSKAGCNGHRSGREHLAEFLPYRPVNDYSEGH